MESDAKSYNYIRALIIVSGKSEKKICQYIIQSLRLNIKIKEDKQDNESNKIKNIVSTLNDAQHETIEAFFRSYKGIEIEGIGEARKIKNFKIFVILDLNQCNEAEKQEYINKTIFKNHWAYEYIVPIFNDKNLEEVLKECNVPYKKIEFKDRKKNYIKMFPMEDKFDKKTTVRIEIEKFKNMIKGSKKSNLKDLLDYCTSINTNI